MEISLRILLDDEEREVVCTDCDELCAINPKEMYVVLAKCPICEENIGIKIKNVDIVPEKDKQ